MKKTYMRPAAQVIAFDIEKSLATVMVGSNQTSGSINQGDDWSNEREWNAPSWSDAEVSED